MDRSPDVPLLEVDGLDVAFRTDDGEVIAVDDVGFVLNAGETVGIVGESGSGKSQILMAIMGLLARNGKASGKVRLRGSEILGMKDDALDGLRGATMSMIFQDPMTSLNPFLPVSTQLTEVLEKHRGMRRREALEHAIEMLNAVMIPDAEKRIRLYPHEFSGGMRQRVMIAMALLCRPALLLADEPTTALDVTVQAQILDLLKTLAATMGTTVVIVTHDLGVVASLCDRVIVLYGGRVMESGTADEIFFSAMHPYTQGLLRSTLRLDGRSDGELYTIPGQPNALSTRSKACPFAARCAVKDNLCHEGRPPLQKKGTRSVACRKVAL